MKPNEIRIAAPARLADCLGAIGYKVELVITRSEVATVDPGSLVPELDAPFTDHDKRALAATIAAYEVGDKADQGPRFEAPQS